MLLRKTSHVGVAPPNEVEVAAEGESALAPSSEQARWSELREG